MQSVLIPAPATLVIIIGVFVAGAAILALGLAVGKRGDGVKVWLRRIGLVIVGLGVPVALVMALSGPRAVDDEAIIDNIEHTYSVSGVTFADEGYDTDTIKMPAGPDSPILHGYHGDDPVEFVVGFTGDKPTSITVVGDSSVSTADLVRVEGA